MAKVQSSIAQMQLNESEQKMTLEATRAINQLDEAALEVALTTKSVEQAKEVPITNLRGILSANIPAITGAIPPPN